MGLPKPYRLQQHDFDCYHYIDNLKDFNSKEEWKEIWDKIQSHFTQLNMDELKRVRLNLGWEAYAKYLITMEHRWVMNKNIEANSDRELLYKKHERMAKYLRYRCHELNEQREKDRNIKQRQQKNEWAKEYVQCDECDKMITQGNLSRHLLKNCKYDKEYEEELKEEDKEKEIQEEIQEEKEEEEEDKEKEQRKEKRKIQVNTWANKKQVCIDCDVELANAHLARHIKTKKHLDKVVLCKPCV